MDKPADSTDRYARKKEAIVAAAAGIMNRRGVKGMTLADVAASVDLITTSVTYYFKKKEDLAVDCFLASIARFNVLIDAALTDNDPRERLKRFITLYLELNRRIRQGEEAPMAMFNDIRALKEPHLSRVLEPYNAMFRNVRTLFAAPGYEYIDRKMATARIASGTRCGRFIFIFSPAIDQTAASRSISAHSAARSSPGRTKVSVASSSATRVSGAPS